jgi:hypothetical protein
MSWLIFGAAVLGTIIGAAIMGALRRAAGSFAVTGQPTPNEAKAEARAEAQEVLHAPDSDISARIEQLRARGRAGK